MTVLSLIVREINIFFAFSWRDWSTTIVAGQIFAIGAMPGLPFHAIVRNYPFLVMWLTFYIYAFDLANQIKGLEEDKIDKPDRPIPSGKVSLIGAKLRCFAAFLTFISMSIYEPQVLLEAFVYVLIIGLLSTSAGKHWSVKNTVAMTIATWSLLSASWKLIAPHTAKSETWAFAVGIWVGITAHIQDLRDIKGDAISGRKTMPLAFGDQTTRLIISFVFIPASLYVLHLGHILELAPNILAILHVVIAYRVLQMRDARYDHKTYMYHTYIFCFILAITCTDGANIEAHLKNLSRIYLDGIGSARFM